MKPFHVIPWTEDFLAGVANRLVAATGGDFRDVLVVFPLRRAARQLCDRLAEMPELPKPVLLPEIVTINDWLTGLGLSFAPTPPVMLDTLDRVALLHEIARELATQAPADPDAADGDANGAPAFPTDMARFFPWGLELAELMEELFRQGVPGQDLDNLDGMVLPTAAALLSRLGAMQVRYRQRLLGEGLATPGLALALAAENAAAIAASLAGRRIFACGFAVLSGSEKSLLKALWRQGLVEFLWHGDPALADPAGRVHFACLEQKRWLGDWNARAVVLSGGKAKRRRTGDRADRPTLLLDAHDASLRSKHLKFFEGHDLHAQLKALEEALAALPDQDDTAVVLPDTGLLGPVLHILPQKDVNISMGYPLARSSLARLLETIMTLQETRLGAGRYHWRELIALIRHPYLKLPRLGEVQPLRAAFHGLEAAIRQGGAYLDPLAIPVPLPEDDLDPEVVAALCRRTLTCTLTAFEDLTTPRQLATALTGLAELLLDPELSGDAWERFLIDAECLFRLVTAVIPALGSGRLADAVLPRETLFALLRRLLADERAAFEADPLTGMQVMGVLETRLLTFRRVFILDAVEDKLPGTRPYEPLVPDPLRRLLSLPDSRERDAVAAYNLYRLLFGAEEITVLYRTGASGTGLFDDNPARSRYVEQLVWEEEKRLGRLLAPGEAPVSLVRLPLCPIPECDPAVPRTPAVAERLTAYLAKKPVTATLLDTYLGCPLRFFYRYLSPLAPLETVAEEGDRAAVGVVVHEVLREFFAPFVGHDIDGADLSAATLMDLYETRLRQSAAYAALPPDGQLLLARSGRARLAALVAHMPRTTPLALETELRASLAVNDQPYLFTGRADRIDRRGEGVLVLDYKTGTIPGRKALPLDDAGFWRRLGEWQGGDDGLDLLREVATRVGSVQLPLYCWLYATTEGEVPADAAFVELRESGLERRLFGARCDAGSREDAVLRHIPVLLGFVLRHVLAAPVFVPRPDDRRCPYCDFRPACGAA